MVSLFYSRKPKIEFMRFFFSKYDIVKTISFEMFFYSIHSFSSLKKSLKRIVVQDVAFTKVYLYNF